MQIGLTHIIEWEKRLPVLNYEWTHWWLEGKGTCIQIVERQHMIQAIQIVKHNFDRFPSIYAYRARNDSEGKIVRQDKLRFKISNRKKDKRLE